MKPSRKDIKDLFILRNSVLNISDEGNNAKKSFRWRAPSFNLCNPSKRIKFYCKSFPNYYYSGIFL